MTARQIIGSLIVASPFIAIFVVITREDDLRTALEVFGFTIGVMAVITVGTYLLVGPS